MSLSSVYLIFNLTNQKIYIGSAVNYKRRFKQHKSDLKLNKHDNKHLQRSFNKYGKQNFLFFVLEKTLKETLIEREQFWIDTLKPEYNIRKVAESNLGLTWKMPIEAKTKISEYQKQKVKTKEHLSNISKALTGIKRSEETKQKISNSKKGIPWSQSRVEAQKRRNKNDKSGIFRPICTSI
jgi:group I intron endonuclease